MSGRRQPSARPVLATFAILVWIAVWATLVASLSQFVGNLPVIVQALFYLIVGIVWIFPLKPLLRWAETGSFAKARADGNDDTD